VGEAAIEVMRTGGYTGATSVNVVTSNGTAVAGVNYTSVSQVLSFAAGQNSQTVMVPITNLSTLASSVTVNLTLSNPGPNATLASQSTATLVIQPVNQAPPPAPLVTLQNVTPVTNRKHLVTSILVGFSGGVNTAEAQSIKTYELIKATKAGLFKPTKANMVKIKSASVSGDTVTLKLKTPLALKKGLELIVDGVPPLGLQDSSGRYIDGNGNGQAGSNAVAILKSTGVTINAVTRGAAAIDALLENGALAGLTKARKK
jgi:hypothetical protein